MIELKTVGIPDLIADLDDISKNQLPYGTAVALTRTAQDAQTAIVNRTLTPSVMTVRTGWYKQNTPFGIKITPARKDTQQAAVYNVAPFMQMQETGGLKVTVTGRKFLAIPSTNVRRTKRELIAKTSYPAVLMKKGGRGFIAQMRSGKLGIWQRMGRARDIRLMYTLQEEAKIKERWRFIETATDTVDRVWKQNWYVEMGKAIQSAK